MDRKTVPIIILALIVLFGSIQSAGTAMRAEKMNIIEISRHSSVEISSQIRKSKGSGFLIADQYVATAFHVVATISVSQNMVNWSIHPDIKVKLPDGEIVSATCVSLPTQADPSPLKYDFAVLKLQEKPKKPQVNVKITDENEKVAVGDDIIFSGFPLATPGMVTHKGMISGFDDSGNIIILQATINKGNSGGAVLTSQGKVIGIISMREGGISKGLEELTTHIEETSQHGSVTIMGVDPLQSTRAIIQTLDQYISTGIGYAISIKFLRSYITAHQEVMR